MDDKKTTIVIDDEKSKRAFGSLLDSGLVGKGVSLVKNLLSRLTIEGPGQRGRRRHMTNREYRLRAHRREMAINSRRHNRGCKGRTAMH